MCSSDLFGSGKSFYDDDGLFAFGLMFHGFDYPSEVDTDVLSARFWQAKMDKGIIEFPRPELCTVRREIRNYSVKNPKIKAEEDAKAGLPCVILLQQDY